MPLEFDSDRPELPRPGEHWVEGHEETLPGFGRTWVRGHWARNPTPEAPFQRNLESQDAIRRYLERTRDPTHIHNLEDEVIEDTMRRSMRITDLNAAKRPYNGDPE